VRVAVVVFPGSNCERDTQSVLVDLYRVEADLIWHESADLSRYDAVILPGGFAHGDHLRAGAIARFSPIMTAVERFAQSDRPVIGICNGFQVLLEAGLLPGAMLRNASLQFRSLWTRVRVDSIDSALTVRAKVGQVLLLPIAHNEGNYFASPELLARLRRRDQVVFRYCDPSGRTTAEANPNGSLDSIAGVCNEGRNVVGLMPHPERACEPELGSVDGRPLFASLLAPVGAALVN
jgi:phosphoribosylformylglycinamidine synthase